MKQTLFIFKGKETMLDVLCRDPFGRQMFKHEYIHENWRCYCKHCGHTNMFPLR